MSPNPDYPLVAVAHDRELPEILVVPVEKVLAHLGHVLGLDRGRALARLRGPLGVQTHAYRFCLMTREEVDRASWRALGLRVRDEAARPAPGAPPVPWADVPPAPRP